MIEVIILHIPKNIRNIILAVLLTRLCVLTINSPNQLFEILSCLWKMKEVLNQVTNSGHKTNFLLEKIVK